LALQAFANVKPDLKISYSDITFSDKSPTVGKTITVTAVIHNESIAQADGVVVRFYDGPPDAGGVLISENTIASVASYGSSQATTSWTVQNPGTHAIFVMVDPDNAVPEIDDTNNTALNYMASATLADLSVSSADIAFSPNVPAPDDPVTITVAVRNHGETAAGNVTVDVYNGDPSSGGSIIGSPLIALIDAGGSSTAQVTDSFLSGNHNIFTVIDSADTIAESNDSNNIASRILQVKTAAGHEIDLSVYAGDITLGKEYPVTGDIVIISASVHNQGEADAANILARFYLGDPDSSGVQFGSDIVIQSIAAGGTATVTATLNTTGFSGSKNIYLRIDPNNVIQETMEINNTAFKTIKIAVKTGTDLMVSSGEITFSPSLPVSGDMVTITAKIRDLSTVTANNVLVEFSDGDPNIAGSRIIGSVVIPSISTSQYSPGIAQITFDTTGMSGMHDIYVNVDPLNQIAELDEKDNIAYAPLNIAPPQKPDITITSIDRSGLITDTQANEISGSVSISLENIGIQDTQSPFIITLYENNDNNVSFDPETDNILGQITYSGNIAAGASGAINMPVSGNVLFRDNIVYAFADSDKEIDELDEGNNTTNTAEQCKADKPVCDDFDVVEKFAWTGGTIFPASNAVYGMPIVAQLTDDNGDSAINNADTPDIIFHADLLRAISGDDGHDIFNVTNPDYFIYNSAHVAAGDIDNDGIVEIVGFVYKWKPQVVAFENDGTVKWASAPITIPLVSSILERIAVSIADIDSDGSPEIICGPNILNSDGTIRWSVSSNDAFPTVADLDMDGDQEIIMGKSAYRNDGTLYWTNSSINTDYVAHAVANLDGDPYPEIVQVIQYGTTDVWVYVFEHDGPLKWGPVKLGSSGFAAIPTIADFDGDEKPEIGISATLRYSVLEADGKIKWQSVLYERTFGGISAAAFDFDGDGAVEIVHNDMQHLRILSGRTGEILFSTPNSTVTYYDSTVVADVDNDGSAEIITNANYGYTFDYRGIRVFENACDRWENTRKIWNEYNYHITNVNDDGTIPQHEQNNWEAYNNYRSNLLLPGPDDTPDITTSLITVDPSNYPDSVTISARIGNGGAA
ncbi:MAG: hypothetical protein OEU95_06360, partial [Nitrospirota bacterium]|nr:hypothetical protein [Nitrospirota bacterium]